MGFLDNVRNALKDAISTQLSKDAAAKDQGAEHEAAQHEAAQDGAVTKDDLAVDTSDSTAAEDPATPSAADNQEAREKREDAREAKFETYTVKTGDTLSEIGARFRVSHVEIAELNNIENPDLIYPGQVFRIPKN